MPARRIFRSLVILATLFTSLSIASPALAIPAEINKSFSPTVIEPGQVSVLTIRFFNPNVTALTSAAVTDTFPPGLFIDATPGVTNDCDGTVTAPAGGTSVAISGATIPPKVGTINGTCRITVRVTSTQQGNLINTIPANALATTGGETNSSPASATLTVQNVAAAVVTKSVTPSTVWVGQNAMLTVNVRNADSQVTLTNVSMTDNVPANVTIAGTPAPTVSASCGGGAVSTTTTSATLNGASIAPGATCTFTVPVVSSVAGSYTNIIPASSVSSRQGVTNTGPDDATWSVQNLRLTKSFTPSPIAAGGISRLRITFENPTGSQYTGASLTDTMPAGVTIADPATPNTTCGGSVTTTTDSVTLTGGTIPAGSFTSPGSCFIEVNVTSSAVGAHNNTIPAGDMATDQGATNDRQVNASLQVQSGLTGAKSFTPGLIAAGGVSRLQVTLRNPTGTLYTGVTVTDNLPDGVTVATPLHTATTCGGAVTTTATSVTLAGGSIPAGTLSAPGTCTFEVDVTSSSIASYTNTIPANAVTTDQSVTNSAPMTATLRVEQNVSDANRPTGGKSFTPPTITASGISVMLLQINAPGGPLTNVTYTDTLPANVVVANPPGVTTSPSCGGGIAVTAPAGATSVQISGASVPGGGNCQVRVNVTSTLAGAYTNTIPIGAVSGVDETGTPVQNAIDWSATLNVRALTVTKAFAPATIGPNGRSTATVQIVNHSSTPLTGVALTDNLPNGADSTQGLRIADPAIATTDCGGAVTAAPGGGTVTLSGGAIPASASGVPGRCTITFDVVPQNHNGPYTSGSATNTIAAGGVTTAQGVNNADPASATINFTGVQITVNKDFDPLIVSGGETSVLSVRLINPMSIPIVGAAFTDNMPPGMILASPPLTNTTCGGTVSAVGGGTSFSFSGGTVPANSSCVVSVNVTSLVSGNLTNTIPIGGVTSFTGASNTQPAEASLTYLPGLTLIKTFSPQTIAAGGTSVLTLQISNTNPFAITGVNLTDDMPAQITVASPLTTTNTCGGSVSATVGGSSVSLVNGLLNANQTCAFSVVVTSATTGAHLNTIPANAVSTAEEATNTVPVSDTLTVTTPTTASLGDFVWADLNANGVQDAGESGLSGVTVKLFQAGGATPLATTTTSGAGAYSFTGLPPGDYVVQFVLPGGFTFSPLDAGGNDALDSDADTTTGRTGTISLAVGENNLSVDAGLVGANVVSLGDFVWLDSNTDGLQDAGEPGMGGVTVNLFRSDGLPVGTTVTDELGHYLFLNLIPGDYYAEFVPPGGYTISPQNTGGDDTLDSDADPANGRTAVVSVVEGRDTSLDAGLAGAPLASLGDFVWEDSDANGAQGAGEPGLAGVTVRLYTSGGQLVTVTTTDSAGHYAIGNLAPGGYVVEFVLPGGYAFVGPAQGGDPALDSDPDPGTGRTVTITLTGGESNLSIDAGLSRTAAPPPTPGAPAQPAAAPAVTLFDPALSKVGVLESGALGLPGEQLTWLFTITNIGGATGNNLVLTDSLRPELRIDSADTDRGTVTVSGQTVTFNIPTLAPGESIGARVRTTVLRRPDGGVIENEGVLTGTGSGGEQVRRVATAQITPPGSLPATGYAPPADLPAGALALGAAGLVVALLGGWLIVRRRRAG